MEKEHYNRKNYHALITRNYTKDRCGFTFLVSMMMLFSVYLLPFATFLSWGELLLFISMIGLLLRYHTISMYKSNALFMFVTYGIIVSIIMTMIYKADMTQTISRLFRDGFYWILIYVLGYSFLNNQLFRKWVKVICTCLSIYIITQFVVYMLTGYLIPGFPMNAVVSASTSSIEIYNSTIESALRNGYLKANGFLTEGAHCGQALSIGIVVIFDFDKTDENDKTTFGLMLIFSLASILTFSATGLALVGIVWIAVILTLMKSGRISKKIALPIFFMLILLVIFVVFAGNTLNISSVVNRILHASSSSTADNSTFFRLYRGFELWKGLPFENKIFGIGFGNIKSLSHLSKGMLQGIVNNEYMNTISYILISSGVLGSVLYLVYIIQMYIQTNRSGRVMVLLLFMMSLSASPYSSVFWVWMMMFIISRQRSRNR